MRPSNLEACSQVKCQSKKASSVHLAINGSQLANTQMADFLMLFHFWRVLHPLCKTQKIPYISSSFLLIITDNYLCFDLIVLLPNFRATQITSSYFFTSNCMTITGRISERTDMHTNHRLCLGCVLLCTSMHPKLHIIAASWNNQCTLKMKWNLLNIELIYRECMAWRWKTTLTVLSVYFLAK